MRERIAGSVFVKLVAVMLTMAVTLVAIVGAFFWFVVGPNFNTALYRLSEDYSRAFAATSPTLGVATTLSERLDVHVRYEGPGANWTTNARMPSVDDVVSGRVRESHALVYPRYYVVPAPQGGNYLFGWNFSSRLREAHVMLLSLLLAVMAAIVLVSHLVLRRLLRPLRVLNEGVARLSEGQLDVALPNGTRDEFGRLTSAFNTMVGRVRDMVRSRDQLLIDVSHELRSPLTRMKVALELAPDANQRAQLGADVAEMERMVAELLELERLRSGHRLELARQDLVPIVRDVAYEFRDRAPGVRVAGAAGELMANVDAPKIKIVLRNLLENAIKYSVPSSCPVEISATKSDDTITIRVTDDGIGIADKDIDRVFEPFYRVDASRSKATGGYGLGLSICKRVMEAHGGEIVVEKCATRGSSFVLRLPG